MANIYTILEEIKFEEKSKFAKEQILKGGDNDQLIFSIIQKFYEALIVRELESHKELKRLQKEIDDANDEQDIIMQNSWGKGNQLTSEQSTRHEHLNVIKYDKQAKIKQIIEEL